MKARIRRMRHPPLLGRPRPLLRPFILVIDLVEIQTCRMHFSPSPTASHIRHPFQIHTHKCREEDGDDADAQMDWLESSPPAESGQKTRESADSRVGNGASFRRRRRNWREKFCRIGCPISRERLCRYNQTKNGCSRAHMPIVWGPAREDHHVAICLVQEDEINCQTFQRRVEREGRTERRRFFQCLKSRD